MTTMAERSTGPTYGDIQRIVCDAIEDMVGESSGNDYTYIWVRDMTDDVAIYESGGDSFEVPYSLGDGNVVTLGDPTPVMQVTTYEPVAEGKSARRDSHEFRSIRGQSVSSQPLVSVRSEPTTYRRGVEQSYFRDRALAELRGDPAAQRRLQRHAQEMETRVNPSPTDGQGGYFSPPLWLIKDFSTANRPGRVLADLYPQVPLPMGASSVNLPVMSTGTSEGAQSSGSGTSNTDIVDALGTSTVVTISGQADVSLQLLEQSPAGAHLDWALMKDLAESYDAQLETQLINGMGAAANQLLGVLNVANIVSVAFTTGSPTGILLDPILGQAAAQLGDGRDLPPECFLMRTARWAWYGSAEDGSNRPFIPPGGFGGFRVGTSDTLDSNVGPTPIGPVFGWPCFLDDAIPATLGAGGNQDAIIAIRVSDGLLLESAPKTMVGEEVLSGTLQARIQLRHAVAAVTSRRPAGIAVVSGTGLVVASNY
jgi:HK97 family phage major capsid protein